LNQGALAGLLLRSASLVLALTSCAPPGGAATGGEDAALDEALQSGRWGDVDALCSAGDVAACTAGDKHALAAVDAVPCGAVPSLWARDDSTRTYALAAARRTLRCGAWTYFFEHVLARPDGPALLVALDGEHFPIEANLFAYLAAVEDRFPELAAEQGTLAWLVGTKRFGHCAEMTRAFADEDPSARVAAMAYFSAAGCQEAAPLAEALLGSDAYVVREVGCKTLVFIGKASSLPLVETVAAADPATVYVEGSATPRYPVREACRQAVDALRGDGPHLGR